MQFRQVICIKYIKAFYFKNKSKISNCFDKYFHLLSFIEFIENINFDNSTSKNFEQINCNINLLQSITNQPEKSDLIHVFKDINFYIIFFLLFLFHFYIKTTDFKETYNGPLSTVCYEILHFNEHSNLRINKILKKLSSTNIDEISN